MLKSPKDAHVLTADVALTGVLEEGDIKLYGVKPLLSALPPSQYVGGGMQEGHILTQTFEEAYYIGANLNGH